MVSRFVQHFGTFSVYFVGLFVVFAVMAATALVVQVYIFRSEDDFTVLQAVKAGMAMIGSSAVLALIITLADIRKNRKRHAQVACDICGHSVGTNKATVLPADRISRLARADFMPSRLPTQMRDLASRSDIADFLSRHPLADEIVIDTSDFNSSLKSLWQLTVASIDGDWTLCTRCLREVTAAEQAFEPLQPHRPDPPPVPARPRPSAGNGERAPPASAGFAAGSDAALFIFDYDWMDVSYSLQAFRTIHEAMARSTGACAFSHGDLEVAAGGVSEVPALLSHFKAQGWTVEPASATSDLKDLSGTRKIAAYAVSMWTEDPTNIVLVHNHLKDHLAPAYLGCLVSRHSFGTASQYLSYLRPYALPHAIEFKDGRILPDTNEIGI